MPELFNFETIHSFLENSARLYPHKIAASFEGISQTYKEIDDISNSIRDFVIEKTQKGDRVAILIDNSLNFIHFYFGVLKAGCAAVLLNPSISDSNLLFQLKDSLPKILFYEEKFNSKLNKIALPDYLKKINISVEKISPSGRIHERGVAKEDTSTIIYTSGTTSRPKGVVLQHENVVNASKNITEFINNNSQDSYLSILSLSHSFGLGNIHVSFMMGGSVVIERNSINIRRIIDIIKEKNITFFAATPATLSIIKESYMPLFEESAKNLKILMSNTSSIHPEVITSFLKLPRLNFCYYYGLTEASRSTFINFKENNNKLNSIGKAAPNVKVEIRDGEVTLGQGKIGEICIYGKHVSKGYWNSPESTQKVINGWLYTGDVGYTDDEGFIYLTGRKDDIINVSGEKVCPDEIERLACSFPGIREAAAIGIPDRLLNQVVKLYIVPEKQNQDFSDIVANLTSFLRARLEPYKVPRETEVVDTIPMTEMGKLKRSELRKHMDTQKNNKSLFDSADEKKLNLIQKTFLPQSVFIDKHSEMFLRSIKGRSFLIVGSNSALKAHREFVKNLLNGNTMSFFEFSGEPTIKDKEVLLYNINKEAYDSVIGFGGGSVLDLVKSIKKEINVPLILIPTTIGTGSETSQFSLLLDGNNKKILQGKELLPEVVILNSEFLRSLTEEEVFFSSIDALSHSLEGLVSKAANTLSDSMALSAIDYIIDNLPKYLENKDHESLKKLQIAGFLSGIVQSTASVGLIHSLAHHFGPSNNLRHSRAIAAFMIPVLRLNIANSKAYEKLNFSNTTSSETLIEDLTKLFSKYLYKLNEIYDRIKLDISEKEIEEIRNDVCTRTNPFTPAVVQIRNILIQMGGINSKIKEDSSSDIYSIEPFSLSGDDKNKVFMKEIRKAFLHHYNNSKEFKKLCDSKSITLDGLNFTSNLPYLPVNIFKSMKLLSVPDEEIDKTITSSATSTGIPSKVYLDKITIKRQIKSLTNILSDFLGKDRLTFIVFDNEKTSKAIEGGISSRGSAIRGLFPFASSMHYVLNEDLSLNIKKLEEATSKLGPQDKVCFFGFTWLIYKVISENSSLKMPSLPVEPIVLHIGGWKKLQDLKVSKEVFSDKVASFLGCSTKNIRDFYGMTEQLGSVYIDCEQGFKHVPVYSDLLIRDINDFSQKKVGEQGFIQIISPIPNSYPGISILTEDIGELVGEDDCACGRKGKYFLFRERAKKAEPKGCGDTLQI